MFIQQWIGVIEMNKINLFLSIALNDLNRSKLSITKGWGMAFISRLGSSLPSKNVASKQSPHALLLPQ